MRRAILTLAVALILILPSSHAATATDRLGDVVAALPVIRGMPFQAETLDGKVVLVAFFASWCPPCEHEFPHLNTVQNAYGAKGFQVVAVNVFETFDGLSTPEKLEIFLDQVEPVFPVLRGDAGTRRIFGNLDRIPTIFLFDRGGAPAFVFRHERDAEKTHVTEEELREVIEPLL